VSGVFDLIVSNPPYVSTGELRTAQPELAAEPRTALDGGSDGLAVIRRLVQVAPAHLRRNTGWLMVEIGADQEEAVAALAAANGAANVSVEKDYAGLPRVLCAQW
jgi:release factor glutamine methyltransferase